LLGNSTLDLKNASTNKNQAISPQIIDAPRILFDTPFVLQSFLLTSRKLLQVLATSSSPKVRAREWMRARWERWESEEKIG
jgi:hypothetical protein